MTRTKFYIKDDIILYISPETTFSQLSPSSLFLGKISYDITRTRLLMTHKDFFIKDDILPTFSISPLFLQYIGYSIKISFTMNFHLAVHVFL
jgi:hypothetical protein